MASTVRSNRRDAVGWIVMDRPDAHNALTVEMARSLADAVSELAGDRSVRAIVLAANGPSFNVGADLDELAGDATDDRRIGAVARHLHRAIAGLVGADQPVVTAVNGTAAGGGFGLALCGDIVVMSETATLTYAYPRIGLSGDGGATWLLPALVGHRRAREIALLDEPIDAETAAASGLVTRVVPPAELESTVDEIATRLAAGPTRAYAAIKRLMREASRRTLVDQLHAEADALVGLTATDDYAAGLAAFGTDEDPDFVGT